MIRILLALGGAALLAGCAPTERDEANRRALAEARPAGAPVDCVDLVRISHTRIRDDRTIDFHMRGGTVYQNTLPNACSGLVFEDSFSYKTSLSRLCSVDTITVRRGSGIDGPTCGLGKFQPIETSFR